jgi:superfamily I DNA/RNA helicase
MSEPTEEQKYILTKVRESIGGKTVAIQAIAGSGKSSSLRLIVDDLKPKKVLYTAFNKAIVEEAKEKFPDYVECKTYHALAYQYVKPKLGIQDFSYKCITESLSYPNKLSIINVLNGFFMSDELDADTYISNHLDDKLGSIASKYLYKMINEEMPVTFSFLLKYFHLMLAQNLIEIKYDLMCLDEVQDVSKISLAIFNLMKADRKVIVGDTHQNIYSEFMGTVNAFDKLKNTEVCRLTKSFRCSTEVAERVEVFGKYYFDKSFSFKGTDKPKEYKTKGYMTLTNAQIIYRIHKLHEEGIRYSLTRPIKDIFACPLAIITAASGKQVYHYKYRFLEDEYKKHKKYSNISFFSYLKQETADEEIKNAIRLIHRFNELNINIFDVMADAKKAKRDPNVLVSTAYSAKGLTFNSVYIEDDLNKKIVSIIHSGGPSDSEESTLMKVAYVAATRVEHELLNCKYL